MSEDFVKLLNDAKTRCKGILSFTNKNEQFLKIYPFTTENINGYIDMFNLKNKSLLTVGSSGDQVINASLKGCENQTVLDICSFSKYYFYLKKAALLTLDYEDFIKFFCYKDYPKIFEINKEVFNINSFKKLESVLKTLNQESFLFWKELFSCFLPIEIRKNLFTMDESRLRVQKEINLYLKNKEMYNKSKISIKNINPKFITGDIFKIQLIDKYDNIFLSNLGTWYSVKTLKDLVDKISLNLNDEGKMLLCYLYKITIDAKYNNGLKSIYNLSETYEILGQYITNFESFMGTCGVKSESKEMKDSVMIYEKRRTN